MKTSFAMTFALIMPMPTSIWKNQHLLIVKDMSVSKLQLGPQTLNVETAWLTMMSYVMEVLDVKLIVQETKIFGFVNLLNKEKLLIVHSAEMEFLKIQKKNVIMTLQLLLKAVLLLVS